MSGFSLHRFAAVLFKEFIQMRRDQVTFAMMIGLPIIQLMLFGFAINADPRHLPTLVEMGDDGPLTRAVIAGLDQSGYFDFRGAVRGVEAGNAALRRGEANFVVVIPPGFERDVVRGRQPEILLAADASDPSAVGGATAALSGIVAVAVSETLQGALTPKAGGAPFSVVVHRQYNPEGKTSTNIVPGLLAIILSMTMVMITAVAIENVELADGLELVLLEPHGEHAGHARIEARAQQRHQPPVEEALLEAAHRLADLRGGQMTDITRLVSADRAGAGREEGQRTGGRDRAHRWRRRGEAYGQSGISRCRQRRRGAEVLAAGVGERDDLRRGGHHGIGRRRGRTRARAVRRRHGKGVGLSVSQPGHHNR